MPFRSYPNITLTSLDGDLSVVVYLPIGVHHPHRHNNHNQEEQEQDHHDEPYYYSSRFDHGSMIGSITRRRRRFVSRNSNKDYGDNDDDDKHVLFGTDMWRLPHNTYWPESGVGLASEFGVGDDGAICDFRCGWSEATSVTNGLLGYQDANNGDSFLKIGVGELIKGTCPACDSSADYRFNSPYLFAKQPVWNMTRPNGNDGPVILEHQAMLRNYGYYLRKEITLVNNVLSVTSTLQNLGNEAFSTVWYSHNFFTCDSVSVGPGYSIDLNLKGDSNHPLYEEPATWSWSKPLSNYGRVRSFPNSVHLEMTKTLVPGERIKAEFADDHETMGGYTIAACETAIESRIVSPQFAPRHVQDPTSNVLSMYAYNMYIERSTFSPEPQLLINDLQPNAAVSWTQIIIIHDDGYERTNIESAGGGGFVTPNLPNEIMMSDISGSTSSSSSSSMIQSFVDTVKDWGSTSTSDNATLFGGICTIGMVVLILGWMIVTTRTSRYHRRRNYVDIS